MFSYNTLFLSVAVAAATWSLTTAHHHYADHNVQAMVHLAEHPVVPHGDHHPPAMATAAPEHTEDPRDQRELMNYALLNLTEFSPHIESYGGTDHWSPRYDYHWMDFDQHGEVVRICHAVDKHNHNVRYIAMWDAAHGRWSQWTRLE